MKPSITSHNCQWELLILDNVSKSILLFDKRGNDRIPPPPYKVPKLHPHQYYKTGNSAGMSCQLGKD